MPEGLNQGVQADIQALGFDPLYQNEWKGLVEHKGHLSSPSTYWNVLPYHQHHSWLDRNSNLPTDWVWFTSDWHAYCGSTSRDSPQHSPFLARMWSDNIGLELSCVNCPLTCDVMRPISSTPMDMFMTLSLETRNPPARRWQTLLALRPGRSTRSSRKLRNHGKPESLALVGLACDPQCFGDVRVLNPKP